MGPGGDFLSASQIPEFPRTHRGQGVGDALPQELVGVDSKPPQVFCGVLGLVMPAGIEVALELPEKLAFLGVQMFAVWRNRGRAHDRHAQGNIREASFLPNILSRDGW